MISVQEDSALSAFICGYQFFFEMPLITKETACPPHLPKYPSPETSS